MTDITQTHGKLLVIGGAEDREGECVILKEFVKLAKGPRARIVVMTVATDHPEESFADYKKVFQKMGVDDVKLVDVSAREDADSVRAAELLEEATGVFFTGGDQLHITSLLGGTPLHEILHKRFEKGLVLAGTSAGAAMMSNSMFIRGRSEDTPRFGGMELGPGMDFLRGALIDTHFSQRGRIGRLLTAVAHYPQDLGLGVDENTAMIVQGQEFEVIGEGSVTVVDAGDITYTNLPDIDDGEAIALYNVKLHVLPAGHRFDLGERKPVINQESHADKNKSAKSKGSSKE